MSRMNPFADLSTDFAPKTSPAPKPVEKAQIDRLSEDSGFHSRQPAPATRAVAAVPANPSPERPVRRRRTTGRNQQLNIKATAETIAQFYRLADERDVPLGELLAIALAAIDKAPRR